MWLLVAVGQYRLLTTGGSSRRVRINAGER